MRKGFKMRSNFLEVLRDSSDSSNIDDSIEDFEWRNRQAKYVTSIKHTYEYFGYEYYMPLWEKSFVDYWRNIPTNNLVNQKLYIKQMYSICKKQKLKKKKDYTEERYFGIKTF